MRSVPLAVGRRCTLSGWDEDLIFHPRPGRRRQSAPTRRACRGASAARTRRGSHRALRRWGARSAARRQQRARPLDRQVEPLARVRSAFKTAAAFSERTSRSGLCLSSDPDHARGTPAAAPAQNETRFRAARWRRATRSIRRVERPHLPLGSMAFSARRPRHRQCARRTHRRDQAWIAGRSYRGHHERHRCRCDAS